MADDFYWRNNRDSILTPAAINMFQILANHDGEDFDEAKDLIDSEYRNARGTDKIKRHGGQIKTQIRAFQEAGWVELEPFDNEKKYRIKITDAGKQARIIIGKLPDFLKAAPYFVLELLTRYQVNNPARPDISKNPEYDQMLQDADVFPYWTLYKIMRNCDSFITSDELKRFVFKIQKSEEIPNVIAQINEYRKDVNAGLSEVELDKKYPEKLKGAISEPKYIMGRLGTQVGKYPPVILKEGTRKWYINENYLPFIDEILANEPIFKEHITEKSWMAEHGKFIEMIEDLIPPVGKEELEEEDEDIILHDELSDDDPIWMQTKDLLEHGASGIMYAGPPGTSKTWYASRIAIKLAKGKNRCIKHVQFHPSYNYDDFVEGYVASGKISSDDGSELFKVVDHIFLKLATDATKNPDDTYVLVVDEFSRGDTSRIFGEILTYIEKDYRNKKFILPYSGRKRFVPDNIVILGTMNPYDKSVSDLDAAMERRFEVVPLDPNVVILKKLVTDAGMESELMGRVITFFNEANKKCPHGFGHTYFLNCSDQNDLIRIWNHKLRFMFQKMFRFEQHVYNDLKEAYKKCVNEPDKLN